MRRKIPELIRDLFQIDTGAESTCLKNKAMSFVRNGLLPAEAEQAVQRKQWFVTDADGVTILHNALLLSAFFPDPKYVKAIFDKPATRLKSAEELKALFTDRQALLGVALLKPAAVELVECLQATDSFNLRQSRLPSPFEVLPQLGLSSNMMLMSALLAQSASLDAGDSLLAAYLAQDWERASQLCDELEGLGEVPVGCRSLVEAVRARYREAQEFDELLDRFR
ncbi:MAG: hypothetical protein LAT61_09835 [Alcanivorax sp.]|nr:hypothetical protein [Alcanivorax sp.]